STPPFRSKVGPDGRLFVLSFFGGRILAISGISAGNPALSVSPTSVVVGTTVTATWSGITPPPPSDWIGLYGPGTAETAFIEFVYVSCTRSPTSALAAGSCPFAIPAGPGGGP